MSGGGEFNVTQVSTLQYMIHHINNTSDQQIIDIKQTIIKMFINRGFINSDNKDKYTKKLIN